jgi:hypothetical protein
MNSAGIWIIAILRLQSDQRLDLAELIRSSDQLGKSSLRNGQILAIRAGGERWEKKPQARSD